MDTVFVTVMVVTTYSKEWKDVYTKVIKQRGKKEKWRSKFVDIDKYKKKVDF